MREIDESLRRLRTDHIDIYQVHWPDPLVPSRKPPRRCARSTIRGRFAPSASAFSVAQTERSAEFAPLHVLQPPYNLFERAIEADILPYCRANNIATLGMARFVAGC